MLCYLSVGQTHKTQGFYRDNIAAGLKYLETVVSHADGDDLVWYGVATTALCEAYGMTGDRDVGRYAQKALDSIARRQDADSGGWAAGPGKKPSMLTTAWQVPALKLGQVNGLNVNAKTLRRAVRFLEKVQADGGATYGETAPGKEPAATAMGLLCRQYLGAKRDDPAMQRGIAFLGGLGPSKTDLAFDYFATEALRNYSGYEWDVLDPRHPQAVDFVADQGGGGGRQLVVARRGPRRRRWPALSDGPGRLDTGPRPRPPAALSRETNRNHSTSNAPRC